MESVLVVSDRRSVGERLGTALQSAGFDVMSCPGPQPPGYLCLGGVGRRCPLAVAADAVVIDCDLASDGAMQGTPSWQLIDYYGSLGLPVVALAGPNELGPASARNLTILPPATDDRSVVAAVRRAIRAKAS